MDARLDTFPTDSISVEATRNYDAAFGHYRTKFEETWSSPYLAEFNFPKLLEAKRYQQIEQALNYANSILQWFFDGMLSLNTHQVDPLMVELTDRWKHQCHLLLVGTRCQAAVYRAHVAYSQNNGFTANFVSYFLGNGRVQRDFEMEQRAQYTRAVEELNAADSEIASHFRILQMETSRIGRLLSGKYPEV